jgi:hypothetical protein
MQIAAAIENTVITKLTLNCETSSSVFILGRTGINIEFPNTRIIGIELMAKIVMPLCLCFGNDVHP